ncbi:MAG: hypothetical protein J6K13_00670 [Clostridia bacterium]|nr:hypothetical protein [Clostridia bacterium]
MECAGDNGKPCLVLLPQRYPVYVCTAIVSMDTEEKVQDKNMGKYKESTGVAGSEAALPAGAVHLCETIHIHAECLGNKTLFSSVGRSPVGSPLQATALPVVYLAENNIPALSVLYQ